MKKAPFIAVILILVMIVTLFCSCEFSVGLGGKDASDTSSAGDSVNGTVTAVVDITNKDGEVVGTSSVTLPAQPVTAIEKITDESGNVVSTQVVTLSPADVVNGKDFFDVTAPSGTPSGNSTTKNNNSDGTTITTTKNNSTTNLSQTTTKVNSTASSERIDEGTEPNARDDEAIFKTKKYYVKGRIVKNGVTSEYRIAQDGGKYAAVTAYDGVPVGFIINTTDIYILQPSEKTYMTIPRELLEEASGGDLSSIIGEDALNSDKTVSSRGTKLVDGVNLSYIKYDDGSVDYYSGKAIIMSTTEDGATVYYDEVSGNVSAGMFAPPAGYTEKELTAENLEAFASEMGSDLDAESLSTTAK